MPHRLTPALTLLIAACQAAPPDLDGWFDEAEIRAEPTRAPPPPAACLPGVGAVIGATPYLSYADALADSVPGDTIGVCPGVHRGFHVAPHEGPLHVVGLGAAPADTVFDGEGVQPSMLFYRGNPKVTLENFTFYNYAMDPVYGDGAVQISGDTNTPEDGYLIARDLVFRHGRDERASGISATWVNLLVEDCVFEDNTAVGLEVSTKFQHDSRVVVRRTRFSGGAPLHFSHVPTSRRLVASLMLDDVEAEGCEWGSVSAYGVSVSSHADMRLGVRDAYFHDNTCYGFDVSVVNQRADTDVLLDRVTFEDNVTVEGSPAAFVFEPLIGPGVNRIWFRDTAFRRNITGSSLIGTPAWPSNVPAVVAMLYDAEATFIRTDFGLGADENLPADLDHCEHAGFVRYAPYVPGQCP